MTSTDDDNVKHPRPLQAVGSPFNERACERFT
jgi:hypothetical protein